MRNEHKFGITAFLVLSIILLGVILSPDSPEEQGGEIPVTNHLHIGMDQIISPLLAGEEAIPEKPFIPFMPDPEKWYLYTFKQVYLNHILIPTTKVEYTSLGKYYITGYASCECGGSTTTYTGTTCHKADSIEDSFYHPTTCAIDPSVHDFGQIFFIEQFGYYIAEDTGSAVLGKHLDLFFWDSEMSLVNSITGKYEVFAVEIEEGFTYAYKYDIRKLVWEASNE